MNRRNAAEILEIRPNHSRDVQTSMASRREAETKTIHRLTQTAVPFFIFHLHVQLYDINCNYIYGARQSMPALFNATATPRYQRNARVSTADFLQTGCPSCRPTNSVKTLRKQQ